MDRTELSVAMIRKGKTNEDMYSVIGISRSAWFRKLSGASEFTQSEICAMRDILDLDDNKTVKIFFSKKVS